MKKRKENVRQRQLWWYAFFQFVGIILNTSSHLRKLSKSRKIQSLYCVTIIEETLRCYISTSDYILFKKNISHEPNPQVLRDRRVSLKPSLSVFFFVIIFFNVINKQSLAATAIWNRTSAYDALHRPLCPLNKLRFSTRWQSSKQNGFFISLPLPIGLRSSGVSKERSRGPTLP